MLRMGRDHDNGPLSTVYNQWTHLQEFPRFREGVEPVEQLETRG
jgi:hypothetical protein